MAMIVHAERMHYRQADAARCDSVYLKARMAAALRAGGRVAGAKKERRRTSARGARAQQQRGGEGDGSDESDSERTIEQLEQRSFRKRSPPSSSSASQPQRKRWEEMTGNERLWDLWTREKGVLWYLNRSVRSVLTSCALLAIALNLTDTH
jgi:hypothetical protein